MKKIIHKALKAGIVLGVCASASVLHAKLVAPQVVLHQAQKSQDTVQLDLGVQNLSQEVTALEVSIVADDIKKVVSIDAPTGQFYTTHQVTTLANGQEKLVCYIVSHAPDEVLVTDQNGLDFVRFNLQTSGKLEIEADGITIKTIEKAYVTHTYEQVEMIYTEETYTPEDESNDSTGDGNQSGSNDSIGDGNQGDANDSTGDGNQGGSNDSTGNGNQGDANDSVEDTSKPEEQVTLKDIEGHWAQDAIINMASKGIINGYPDGSFKPSASITRGEFAVLLARAFKIESMNTSHSFKDVAEGKWYTKGITALYEAGITSGLPDGTFGVNKPITNEEICTMLYRTIVQLRLDMDVIQPSGIQFTDHSQISEYAKEAVEALTKMGIISGSTDGSFGPKSMTMRAQVAVMLDRILKMMN